MVFLNDVDGFVYIDSCFIKNIFLNQSFRLSQYHSFIVVWTVQCSLIFVIVGWREISWEFHMLVMRLCWLVGYVPSCCVYVYA